jgi:hypothetical protein
MGTDAQDMPLFHAFDDGFLIEGIINGKQKKMVIVGRNEFLFRRGVGEQEVAVVINN